MCPDVDLQSEQIGGVPANTLRIPPSPLATPTPLCYSRATPAAPDSSGALGLFVPDAAAEVTDT